MGAWDSYSQRLDVHGSTRRSTSFIRESKMLNRKLKDSMSYFTVMVDGNERNAAVINSDNINEKMMFSLPGEDFDCGGLVEWADNRWLITEKDANNELYTRVKLVQCNHLLHWVDDDDVIREQWCVIEDGTKLRFSFRVGKPACKKTYRIAGKSQSYMSYNVYPNRVRRERGESRKNRIDGAWLNPKRWCNGQSAAKLRTGERSETDPLWDKTASVWRLKW